MFKILNKKNQSNLESRKYSTQQNSLRLLKKFYPPIYKFMEYLAFSQDKVNIHVKEKVVPQTSITSANSKVSN